MFPLSGEGPVPSMSPSPREENVDGNGVPCLIAIGRLQVTSSPNCADLLDQSAPAEFISRHSVDGKFTFVDQRWTLVENVSSFIRRRRTGVLPKGRFLMTSIACHGVVGQYWGVFPLPSSCSWLGVSQPKSFVYTSPTQLIMRRERWMDI